ncbi:hypothetical protein BJX99DRAFT_50009 [Aspergillus californicus]
MGSRVERDYHARWVDRTLLYCEIFSVCSRALWSRRLSGIFLFYSPLAITFNLINWWLRCVLCLVFMAKSGMTYSTVQAPRASFLFSFMVGVLLLSMMETNVITQSRAYGLLSIQLNVRIALLSPAGHTSLQYLHCQFCSSSEQETGLLSLL